MGSECGVAYYYYSICSPRLASCTLTPSFLPHPPLPRRLLPSQRALTEQAVSVRISLKRQLGAAFAPAEEDGVLVTRVSPGGSAERAGMRVQDVIQAINSHVITSVSDFQLAVEADLSVGAYASVLVRRHGVLVPLLLRVGALGLAPAQLDTILLFSRLATIDCTQETMATQAEFDIQSSQSAAAAAADLLTTVSAATGGESSGGKTPRMGSVSLSSSRSSSVQSTRTPEPGRREGPSASPSQRAETNEDEDDEDGEEESGSDAEDSN